MKSIDEGYIKKRVQSIVVITGIVLLLGKFVAFFITNSVGVLTDAMESIVNVAAGIIGLVSIHLASRPKDEGHPFGHGKFELISASIEGILIIIAGAMIVYEGGVRLFSPSQISSLDIGIYIVAVAGIVNYLLGWYSISMGKKYGSMALIAGGKHLQSDTYSTIGLVLGLVLLAVTGIHWIDSVLAFIFGGVIIFTGWGILRKTAAELTDKSDPEVLHRVVDRINAMRRPDWIDVHNLKLLRYGNTYFVDCDLRMPWYYNISEGHSTCDALEETICLELSPTTLFSVHSDSCREEHCSECTVKDCKYRKSELAAIKAITYDNITKNGKGL